MTGGHWFYIVAAYAVTIVSVGAIVARIVLEHRRLRRELARLEVSGATDEGEAP